MRVYFGLEGVGGVGWIFFWVIGVVHIVFFFSVGQSYELIFVEQ